MKLLLDQNLSHKLVEDLKSTFQLVEHVRVLDLHRSADQEIWDHARRNGYVIVTKDSDFWERAVLDGPPPKIIWIQVGNCTTDRILEVLRSHCDDIKDFEGTDEVLLTIG